MRAKHTLLENAANQFNKNAVGLAHEFCRRNLDALHGPKIKPSKKAK